MDFPSPALDPNPRRDLTRLSTWPVLRVPPSGERRARLLLMTSGQSRDITESGPDAGLLRTIAEMMAPHGVECVNPRLPLREDDFSDTDEALVSLRAEMAARALFPDPHCRTVVLAVSLGTLSAIELAVRSEIARVLDALVLVGCVLECPAAPVGRIGSIDLVYGGRDHVGYLGSGDEMIRDIESPGDYGPKTQRQLVTAPGVTTTMQILPEAGHALEQRKAKGADFSAATALLVPLLQTRLGLSAPIESEVTKKETMR